MTNVEIEGSKSRVIETSTHIAISGDTETSASIAE